MPAHKSERRPHRGAGLALLFLTILAASANAETGAQTANQTANQTATPPPTASQESTPADVTSKPATAKPMSEKEARQAQIAADTDHLYQLAQELKAEVAKSNKDTLSLSVIKKANEVEKLARSLKDRLKTE